MNKYINIWEVKTADTSYKKSFKGKKLRQII